MKIKAHIDSLEVRMVYTLLHVELNDKLSAYKLSRGPDHGQPMLPQLEAKLQLVVEEGIAATEDIQSFLAGSKLNIERSGVQLAAPGLLEAVRTQGFSRGFETLGEKGEAFSRTPFSDLTEGGASVDNLVRVDVGSHMLFAVDGTCLPVAVHCSYIEARMVDGVYDLAKAVQILNADARVRFVDERRHRGADSSSLIHDVPYYNARPGSSKYLSFVFMPTAEDAVRLWAKQKSYGSKYPSTETLRAMFDLDVLGLRAGGAAKYDEYYKSDEDIASSDEG